MKINRHTLRKLIAESLRGNTPIIPPESLIAFYNKEDLTNKDSWISAGRALLAPSIESLLQANLPNYIGSLIPAQIDNGKYVQQHLPAYFMTIQTERRYARSIDLKNLIASWSTEYNERYLVQQIQLIFPQSSDIDLNTDIQDIANEITLGKEIDEEVDEEVEEDQDQGYINVECIIIPHMPGAYLR